MNAAIQETLRLHITEHLLEALAKGEMVDVAIFAVFLWNRGDGAEAADGFGLTK